MASSWVTLVDMASGYYVVEDDMDDLRGNLEKLGAMRWGPDPLSDLDDGDILGGAAFSAYEDGSNQTVTAAAEALMTFNKEQDDTNGWWASNRFTIGSGGAGSYQLACHAQFAAAPGYLEIRRSGLTTAGNFVRFAAAPGGGGTHLISGTCIMSAVAGDYFELYVLSSGTSITKLNGCAGFSGVKIA